MRITPWLAAALVLFTCSSINAGLNDPGEKRITVGSEIARGCEAIRRVEFAVRLSSFDLAMHAVVSANRQRDTDSDGFLCGAKYEMWQQLKNNLEVARKYQFNSAAELALAQREVRQYFLEFRAKQRALNLTDEELATAMGSRTPQGRAHVAAVIQEMERSLGVSVR